jgi:hypothetical protein
MVVSAETSATTSRTNVKRAKRKNLLIEQKPIIDPL